MASEPNDKGTGAVIAGEASLPDEHTARVRAAADKKKADPTALRVHDGSMPASAPAEPPEPPSGQPIPVAVPSAPTSSQLSEASRKAFRRERDKRAEKRAMQVLVAMFVLLGGGALLAVNLMMEDAAPTPPRPIAATGASGAVAKPPPRNGIKASELAVSSDIPAIHSMRSEGLTIAAEGLPEVSASSEDPGVAAYAAIETCRFAYGVWEFSPNKRFRFLSTCEALEGQVLVGAYEIDGATVRMSPLVTNGVQLVSEFDVEKPSRLRTKASVDGRNWTLEVNQRITTMRPGLEGEGFRSTYLPRNTINLPGTKKGGAPAPGGKSLQDLLKQDDPG